MEEPWLSFTKDMRGDGPWGLSPFGLGRGGFGEGL